MDRIHARPHCVRSRLSRPLGLVVGSLVLVIGLGTPDVAESQERDPRASGDTRSALEEIRRLGKLSDPAFERLLRDFAGRTRIRVLVGLNTEGNPFARLKGPQVRSRSTRIARRAAIGRIFERLRDRPGVRTLRWATRFRDVPYAAIEVDANELRRLAAQPEVASIHRDELMQLSLHDTVPQIGADLAWLQGYTGNGQVVAILDGGFDTGHSAFAGRIVDEACYSTTSVVDNTTSLCPDGDNPQGADSQIGPGAAIYCENMFGCDHGTHVAGIAAGDDATYRGIAPDAGILPIQVFSQLNDFFACGFDPPCLSAFTSDIIRGLERVYDLKDTYDIAVVNMSLGGEAYATAEDCDAAYPALKATIDNLRSVGITTVVASGNEYHTSAIAAPACVSSAVSVGAVDVIDAVADFSNSADFLDMLSPGVGIVSAVPGDSFDAKTGTSMASPGVAGTVAVLRSADPEATPDEIVDVMKMTGVPITDWRSGLVTPRVQVDAAAELLTEGDLSRISLALTPLLSGLDEPVGVTHANDGSGRMFIMQRDGTVLIRDAGGLLATPFLDVSAKVGCCAADGLLGLAFHPDYGTNGLVFVSYLTASGEIVVERFSVSADPDQVDPTSAVEIIRIPSNANGHHGGRIHFGADGYLYLATGDAAEDGTVPVPGPSGDPSSLHGKVLRLDVDAPGVPYAVPPDNPLVGVSGARGEIWALGLRDPRRFGFDGLSGELYLADVGESEWHEVDVQAADSTGGEDYGWNVMEGSVCRAGLSCDPSGLVLPVAEYGFDEGCAVTGGVVYRGATYMNLYGTYLFGDLCSGRIWGLRSEDGVWQQAQLAQAAIQVSAFGTDQSGEAFVVDQAAGEVYRLEVSDLSINTVRLSTAYIGAPFSETLSASGGAPPYQWSIVDSVLPAGISLDPVSGTLSGTVNTPISAVFTVELRDAAFARVTRTLRFTAIPPPLIIETPSIPDASTDAVYDTTLTASGGTPPYVWSVSAGSLPAGITLDSDGRLAGTATAQGEFNFTAKVTDAAGDETIQSFSMAVFGQTLVLQVNNLDSGQYGNEYGTNQHVLGMYATFAGAGTDLTLHVIGYDIDFVDELAVYLNGNLLGYLSVGPNNGLNAGDIFDIPAAAQQEDNVLLFKNKTSGWIWGVTDLLLSDQPAPLVITTTTLTDTIIGESYSVALAAEGGRTPYTWSLVGGSLPSGLMLGTDGTLSGTPSEQGTFNFTVRLTDDVGSVLDQAFTLNVVGTSRTVELVLEVGVTDPGAYGNGYGSDQHDTELYATFTGTGTDLTLHVTGYDIDYVDELAVYLNGNLLGYLSKGPNNALNAGDAFFIPAAAQLPGENVLLFKNKTSGWIWGVTDLLLSDQPEPLVVTGSTLPDATVGQGYSQSLTAEGGRTPYSWSLVSGSLPSGIALGADGTLSGSPTEQGVFDFTARVTDDAGSFVDQAFTLVVVGTSGTIELELAINVIDQGQYGHGYGTDQQDTELVARFSSAGTDLTLNVTGYDIDFVDELAVYLNGNLLGYLSVGPDNGLNAGDAFFIPAAAQLPDNNVLLFKNKTSGWIWGVTNLLLSDEATPLNITTAALPDATSGESYSAALEAEGGRTPYTWSLVAGSLPSGLMLGTDGTLSGTPSEQGTFNFTVRLTDDVGSVLDQAFTLNVVGTSGTIELELDVNVIDQGEYGHGYGTDLQDTELYAAFTGTGTDLTLHVTGYDIDYVDELAVYLNGNLLGYLSKGPNNALNAGDTFFIAAAAQLPDENVLLFKNKTSGWIWGVTDLLLSDQPAPLVITTTTLPDATFGEGYSEILAAEGGRTPYTWSLVSGSLPSGIALGADGTLSGSPTEQGVFDFTARVTDDAGNFVDQALSLQSVGASGTIELVLDIGVTDTGEYGYKFGSNQHKTELYATFVSEGTDLTLHVTGYDIDYVDELAVYLNGNLLGYLSKGPNNGFNAGDTFAIPATDQLPGANSLRFEVKTSGWIWGVTDLLIAP